MITRVKFGLFATGAISNTLTPVELERLNQLLKKIAAAYDDDPGVSDLDDEQPAATIRDLNLGDVRLARRLTR